MDIVLYSGWTAAFPVVWRFAVKRISEELVIAKLEVYHYIWQHLKRDVLSKSYAVCVHAAKCCSLWLISYAVDTASVIFDHKIVSINAVPSSD